MAIVESQAHSDSQRHMIRRFDVIVLPRHNASSDHITLGHVYAREPNGLLRCDRGRLHIPFVRHEQNGRRFPSGCLIDGRRLETALLQQRIREESTRSVTR